MFDSAKGSFVYGGKEVCSRFLLRAFKFSNDLQSSVKKTMLGEKAVGKGTWGIGIANLPRETHVDTSKDEIIRFLRNLAESMGDMMPHKSFTNLPHIQRLQVYEQFVEEQTRMFPGKTPASQPYFYRTWKYECNNIRSRRNHGFSECAVCNDLRARFIRERNNEAGLRVLRDEKKLHDRVMREERLSYMERVQKAVRNPRTYCSIIVDGADQKSFGLPHFTSSSKSDKGQKLKVKIVGVLEHKKDNKLSLFAMTEEHETGANHVLEAIHRALSSRKRTYGRLPEILFVQADNCSRENKNRFFMAYFEMLVARGVFFEVQVSFLPVGHTHADIDQAFSCVSRRLKNRDAVTMDDLIYQVGQCYLPRAQAEKMTMIANFSGLCRKVRCATTISGFSKFRYFRFTRKAESLNEAGYYDTECQGKVQGYERWVPLSSGRELNFLRFVPNLADTPPTTTRLPDNVNEINNCLRGVEQRVRNRQKMEALYSLRDMVYTPRTDPLHWNLQEAFELNGDYLPCNIDRNQWRDNEHDEEEHAGSEYEYAPGTFVAVKKMPNDNSRFWIAEVLGTASRSETGRPKMLEILWYTVEDGYDKEFEAKYKVAETFSTATNQRENHFDQIDTRVIMVHFSKLTNSRYLRSDTRKSIRESLHCQ